jgi:hypothetical protein
MVKHLEGMSVKPLPLSALTSAIALAALILNGGLMNREIFTWLCHLGLVSVDINLGLA